MHIFFYLTILTSSRANHMTLSEIAIQHADNGYSRRGNPKFWQFPSSQCF